MWFPGDATDIGVAHGAVTYRRASGLVVSLPWPAPAYRRGGLWCPSVLERHADGTAVGLWRWVALDDMGDDFDD